MRRLLLFASVIIFAAVFGGLAGPGAGLRAETLAGPISADVLEVIDGDTLKVAARIWLGQTITVNVRLADVDTPERRSVCSLGRRKAEAARAFVAGAVGDGPVTLVKVRRGKYAGRVSATVYTHRGTDLGAALIGAGLARPYDGGKRPDWCATAALGGAAAPPPRSR